jgi:hypothetical protein
MAEQKTIEIIEEQKPNKKGLPFLLKASALLLIVYGIIGLSYYLFTALYSIGNREFLEQLEYSNFKGNTLFIPLLIEILLHIIIILAGFFIIYRKNQGSYYFYFALTFSMAFSFFFLGRFNTTEMIIGSILLVIIFFTRKQ